MPQPQQFDQSTYESSYSSGPPPRSRQDSGQVLMLPTPLSVSRTVPATTPSVSTSALSRSSEDGYNSDIGSQQRLVSPQESSEDYERSTSFEARVSRSGGVLRQSTVSAQYPAETHNAYQYSPQTAGYDDPSAPFVTDPEDLPPTPPNYPRGGPGRGVSLADNGPVPGPGGVRRVSRQQGRRPTSQVPQAPQPNQNRYSRTYTNLPPGAAPPQAGQGYGY